MVFSFVGFSGLLYFLLVFLGDGDASSEFEQRLCFLQVFRSCSVTVLMIFFRFVLLMSDDETEEEGAHICESTVSTTSPPPQNSSLNHLLTSTTYPSMQPTPMNPTVNRPLPHLTAPSPCRAHNALLRHDPTRLSA
ncbi:unnamed protein product [Vicia faba]|uniref:Uncharacterized protein n=1 Tax=Vicia faba TaxID=3906 RepID=A0AAV0ZF76_VICFA|nr:unnamed protein product [Vicia faba]